MSDSDCEYIYDEEDQDDMGLTDNADYDSADDKDAMEMSFDDKDFVSCGSAKGSGEKSGRKSTGSTGSHSRTIEEGSYRIVDCSDIQDQIDQTLEEMAELLDLDHDQVLALLVDFRWGKERLIEQYYEDSERVMIKAGLMLSPKDSSGEAKKDESKREEEKGDGQEGRMVDCPICYCPIESGNGCTLHCSHLFCNGCYAQYVNKKVEDGPECIVMTCPGHKCPLKVPRQIILRVCTPQNCRKYDEYMVNTFVDTSTSFRFCPAPDCGKVAWGSSVTSVNCACGFTFCFRCGEEVHDPATCEHLQKWITKCNSESETANWILANTKKCPKCKSRIEKNQGCNHMTCKVCKHDFCWMCLSDWSSHNSNTGGYYKCNKYTEKKEEGADAAKRELDRYLHYYKRYATHDSSLKYVNKDLKDTEEKMHELQQSGRDWSEVQYLKVAREQIFTCRRVLKYTYVLGYYLTDRTKEDEARKQLFEYHQDMLERNTENLHRLVDPLANPLALTGDNRSQVVNLTRVTDTLLKNLLECMMEGETDVVELARQISGEFETKA